MSASGAAIEGAGKDIANIREWLSGRSEEEITNNIRALQQGRITRLENVEDLSGIKTVAADASNTKKVDDVFNVDFTYKKDKARVTVLVPTLFAVNREFIVTPEGVHVNEYLDPIACSANIADQYMIMRRFTIGKNGLYENEYGIAYARAMDVETVVAQEAESGVNGILPFKRFELSSLASLVNFLMLDQQIATAKILKGLHVPYMGTTQRRYCVNGQRALSTTPLRSKRSSLTVYQTMAAFDQTGGKEPHSYWDLRQIDAAFHEGTVETTKYWKKNTKAA